MGRKAGLDEWERISSINGKKTTTKKNKTVLVKGKAFLWPT